MAASHPTEPAHGAFPSTLAGVFPDLCGGAGGLTLAAHGRKTPPSELRLASAIVATTLALLAFIALLAAPHC